MSLVNLSKTVVLLQPDTSVIVVNNSEEGGGGADVDKGVEVSVDDEEEEEGELEVVQPSEQWQTLKPGGALTDIRWDLEGATSSNRGVRVFRAGSSRRLPRPAQLADGPEGGPTGGGAAQVLDKHTQVWLERR